MVFSRGGGLPLLAKIVEFLIQVNDNLHAITLYIKIGKNNLIEFRKEESCGVSITPGFPTNLYSMQDFMMPIKYCNLKVKYRSKIYI